MSLMDAPPPATFAPLAGYYAILLAFPHALQGYTAFSCLLARFRFYFDSHTICTAPSSASAGLSDPEEHDAA